MKFWVHCCWFPYFDLCLLIWYWSWQVGNAQEELLHWHEQHVGDKSHIFCATERCAAAIIQAMEHFDIQPNSSPRDRPVPLTVHDKLAPKADAISVAHEVVEYLMLLEQWLRGDVEGTDEVFNRLKFSLVRVKPFTQLVVPRSNSTVDNLRAWHGQCTVTGTWIVMLGRNEVHSILGQLNLFN